MFGKRKQDRKHRFAEEGSGEVPDGEARPAQADPELAEELLQLGLNRHAPLVEPLLVEASEFDAVSEPAALSEPDALSQPDVPGDQIESSEPRDQNAPDDSDVPKLPAWAVQTAAMLAEPEPEPEPERVESERSSVGGVATHAALRRERAKVTEREAALRNAQDEASALRAELRQFQAAAKATDTADTQAGTVRADELEQSLQAAQGRIEELTAELEALRAAASGDIDVSELRSAAERAASERADAAEKSVQDLQSKVSALTADLERSRSEAAAAGVALERVEREAKDQDGTVTAAEERAERLAAEIEKLRAEAAKGPAQVERLRRESEREKALREAMEQAQASHTQAEAVLADNRRMAADLAANLEGQEALITALIGLQAEVTEQRAWFEAQIANQGETEGQQAGVIETLQAAIHDRDAELDAVRQQLLEAETKRAEEAAAFVASLDRP